MAVDIRFGFSVCPSVRDLLTQLLDSADLLPVGHPQLPQRRQSGPELLVQPGPILGGDPLERVLHLRQQVVVEEGGDLPRLEVHDPVQAEVQITPVKLEHLPEEGPQPIELLLGARGGLRVATRGVGRRRVGHRPGSGRLGKGAGNPLSSFGPPEAAGFSVSSASKICPRRPLGKGRL